MTVQRKIDFNLLDGLRGLAAFYVMVGHARAEMLIGGSAYANEHPIASWSWWDKAYYTGLQLTILNREFVILFFVLSGFSIAYSLRHNQRWSDFYRKRLVRLYPPFLLALAWAALITVVYNISNGFDVTKEAPFRDWQTTLSNIFYIPDGVMIPQFWSLTHEVIFYLLAAWLLVRWSITRFYVWISIAIYAGSLIIEPLTNTGYNIITGFLFDYNIFFVIGILTYRYLDQLNEWVKKVDRWIYYVPLIIFPVLVIIQTIGGLYTKINLLLSALGAVILILWVINRQVRIRFLIWVGKFSYTLYITHFASIFLFVSGMKWLFPEMSIPSHSWLVFIGCVLFSLILAWLLYLIAESPCKRYLDQLRKKSNT